jgi:hypothetical protein
MSVQKNEYYKRQEESPMYGHPAIAHLVANSILDERREEARAYRNNRAAARSRVAARPRYRHRSVRLGRYRLTLSKENPGVPRPV